MMPHKSTSVVSLVSTAIFLSLFCIRQPGAAPMQDHGHASRALQSSLATQGAKGAGQSARKSVDDELDTLFAKIKADFDKMAASGTLKSGQIQAINGFFLQSLKSHEPWHSLIRTDSKGQVVNEVIRIEGVSKEKRSVAKETWFTQVSKTMKEHTGVIIVEKTGRYYLVWAMPLLSKVKGSETFQGAVALQIDLWDCFDRFADKTTTPFMIRMLGRVTLYDHLWKDTIKYVEKPITVPGVDKIAVRFVGMPDEMAIAAKADSAMREQARLDSLRVKVAADSAAAAAMKAKAQKARSRRTAIIAEAGIAALILAVVLVLLIGSRKRRLAATTSGKSRFDNL